MNISTDVYSYARDLVGRKILKDASRANGKEMSADTPQLVDNHLQRFLAQEQDATGNRKLLCAYLRGLYLGQ